MHIREIFEPDRQKEIRFLCLGDMVTYEVYEEGHAWVTINKHSQGLEINLSSTNIGKKGITAYRYICGKKLMVFFPYHEIKYPHSPLKNENSRSNI